MCKITDHWDDMDERRAIEYLQRLERTVLTLRDEIRGMEEGSGVVIDDPEEVSSSLGGGGVSSSSRESGANSSSNNSNSNNSNDDVILQSEVSKVGKNSYRIHLVCRNDDESLQKVVRAFERMDDAEVVNANINCWGDNINCYYLLKAEGWDSLDLGALKRKFLDKL